MTRAEFSRATKRGALKRAEGQCEALGVWYGLHTGERCRAPLSYGVEFDHIVLDANSHDNSLENCAAVCIKCHRWKSANHDTPLAAKTVRQRDKHLGIRHSSRPMAGSRNSPLKKLMSGKVVRR